MRADYDPGHKYDSAFTAFLDDRVVGNSGEDDTTGDIESSFGSVVLIGRHILTYSTTGFVDRDSYPTAAEARRVFNAIATEYDKSCPPDDEDRLRVSNYEGWVNL